MFVTCLMLGIVRLILLSILLRAVRTSELEYEYFGEVTPVKASPLFYKLWLRPEMDGYSSKMVGSSVGKLDGKAQITFEVLASTNIFAFDSMNLEYSQLIVKKVGVGKQLPVNYSVNSRTHALYIQSAQSFEANKAYVVKCVYHTKEQHFEWMDNDTLTKMTEDSTMRKKRGGWRRIEFETSPKMSISDLSIAIGSFVGVSAWADGVEIAMWSYGGKDEFLSYSLTQGIRMITGMRDYLALSFPQKKIDVVLLPQELSIGRNGFGIIFAHIETMSYSYLVT